MIFFFETFVCTKIYISKSYSHCCKGSNKQKILIKIKNQAYFELGHFYKFNHYFLLWNICKCLSLYIVKCSTQFTNDR